jgi:hypothetical protein
MYALVEEQIGCWNIVESNIQKMSVSPQYNEVIYYESQFCLVDVQSLVAYFATAPSQLF